MVEYTLSPRLTRPRLTSITSKFTSDNEHVNEQFPRYILLGQQAVYRENYLDSEQVSRNGKTQPRDFHIIAITVSEGL